MHVACEPVVGGEPAGVLRLVLRGQPVRQGMVRQGSHLAPGYLLLHPHCPPARHRPTPRRSESGRFAHGNSITATPLLHITASGRHHQVLTGALGVMLAGIGGSDRASDHPLLTAGEQALPCLHCHDRSHHPPPGKTMWRAVSCSRCSVRRNVNGAVQSNICVGRRSHAHRVLGPGLTSNGFGRRATKPHSRRNQLSDRIRGLRS